MTVVIWIEALLKPLIMRANPNRNIHNFMYKSNGIHLILYICGYSYAYYVDSGVNIMAYMTIVVRVTIVVCFSLLIVITAAVLELIVCDYRDSMLTMKFISLFSSLPPM